jgi:succinate dehydrogenase assembly factor 1
LGVGFFVFGCEEDLLVDEIRVVGFGRLTGWKAFWGNWGGVRKMARLSGMQKQVLSLYRSFLRAARTKPAESRKDIESFVGAEFRKNAKVDKKDFQSVEFLMRRGHKQLEMLKSRDVSGFSYMAPK